MTKVIAIVGAGPAGIRAAETLANAGSRPILIDEAAQPGGQGYRRIAPHRGIDPRKLMGAQAIKYDRLHRDFDRLKEQIDYRPEALVFAAEGRSLHVLRQGRTERVDADAVILATGAMDRIAPLPGWTLPGVFGLGGAQILLKAQGCLVGQRVVFAGSSPLLALAALQYRAMGAEVVAVCDTTPFSAKARAASGLLSAPATFARGLGYLARLRMAGVPVHDGVDLIEIGGEERVENLVIESKGRRTELACDAVALGHGLKPETQLADLMGVTFDFDATFRLWLPRIDAFGRAGPGLYIAGDGAAIGGADAAETSGRLAAHALLSELDHGGADKATGELAKRLTRQRRFQRGLARAFAWPAARVGRLGDTEIVCRCERVTAGDIRRAMAADLAPVEVNRVKAITRCGMGRCQGRLCAGVLAEIAAVESKRSLDAVGRLRGQAPIKPIPVAAAADFGE